MEQRNTWQKQAVYNALCALDHPSATEVFQRVQGEYPTLSRGTVFRVLGSFAREGKIKKLQLSDSDVRYDFRTEEHFHARCRVCGAVRDVFVNLSQLDRVRADGFFIDGYEVEFFGVCENCRANDEHKTAD